MTKTRVVTLLLLSIVSAVAFGWGYVLERTARGIIVDFKVVYIGTRCLLRGCDPYNENQLMKVYLSEGGKPPSTADEASRVRQVVALQVYFPTAFLYIAPFALLPWVTAHWLWSLLTAAVVTFAAFLMWTLGQRKAPGATFYLISFMLVNSGILFAGGNPAGISVGMCLVAVWCFLEDRFVVGGLFCLAASLALKPHDSGLVWLYFLLAGGALRARAIRAAAVATILGLPAFLWISHASPHWAQELHSNLIATSARGGITDPGPASLSGSGGGMIIDLQTIISIFRNDPSFYNPIAYSICGLLLFAWMFVTLRSRATSANAYLALAAIAPLSMLPLYHRPHDAKLLLLTIPACAMLLAERGSLGKVGLVLNSAAIVLTADLPLGAIAILTKGSTVSTEGFWACVLTALVHRPVPLSLMALSVFYLGVYMRRCASGYGEGSKKSPDIDWERDHPRETAALEMNRFIVETARAER
jgi:hypothetical protein